MKSFLYVTLSIMALLFLSACGSSSASSGSGSSLLVKIEAPAYIFSGDETVLTANVVSEEPYTLLWKQTGGTKVKLDETTFSQLTFTAPDINGSDTLTFELHASDQNGTTASAEVSIELYSSVFIIDAGHKTKAVSGHTVSLHGSATQDDKNTPMQIEWTHVGGDGEKIKLENEDTLNPNFEAPKVTKIIELIFTLHVTAGHFEQEDNVTVIVYPKSQPQTTPVSITAFSGSGTTVCSNILPPQAGTTATHQWSQVSGPTVTLQSTGNPCTSFIAPTTTAGNTSIGLQHTHTATSPNGQVSTTVTPHTVNTVPQVTALAVILSAKEILKEGEPTSLHASASGGSAPYTYVWTQTSGPTVTLDKTVPSAPTFLAPSVSADEILGFDVTITDSLGSSVKAWKAIIVIDLKLKVDAGNDIVLHSGHITHLQGSITHNTIAPYSYDWTQTSGNSLAIADADTLNPSVQFPTGHSGNYEFQLTVTDGANNAATDSVKVDMLQALSVDAGRDKSVHENSDVTLNGLSVGAFGTPTISWKQVSGTTQVTLKDAKTLNPKFTIGTLPFAHDDILEFEMTVTDDNNRTGSDRVLISVIPVLPTPSISAPATIAIGSKINITCNTNAPTVKWSAQPSGELVFTDATSATTEIDITATQKVALTLTCEASDVHGRMVPASQAMSIYELPSATQMSAHAFGSSKVKEGTSTQLSASVNGGLTPYTYAWSIQSGDGSIAQVDAQNPNFTAPFISGVANKVTSITLTVTDSVSQTATSAPLIITVNDDPLVFTNLAGGTAVRGQNVSLHAGVSGGKSPYSHKWSQVGNSGIAPSASANPTLATSPIVVGNYDVNVTVDASDNEEINGSVALIIQEATRTLRPYADATVATKAVYTSRVINVTPYFAGEKFIFAISGGGGVTGLKLLDTTDISTKFSFTAPDVTADTKYTFTITATRGSQSITQSYNVTAKAPVAAAVPIKDVYLCNGIDETADGSCMNTLDSMGFGSATTSSCTVDKPYLVQFVKVNYDGTDYDSIKVACASFDECYTEWYRNTSDKVECTGLMGRVFGDIKNSGDLYGVQRKQCNYCMGASDKVGNLEFGVIIPLDQSWQP